MKKIEADAIRLTSEILRRFWQKDPAYAEDYFADDILWIGAQKDEFLVGVEAVKADLDAALIEIPPCTGVQHLLHLKSKSKILRPIEIMGFFYEFFCQIQGNNLL